MKRIFAAILVSSIVAVSASAFLGAGVVELDEAKVLVEINATDGDAGFHAFFDGDPWMVMRLRCPDGELGFRLRMKGKVAEQGMTEGFFESSEPSFEDQPLEEFLDRFPEGTYQFNGRTTKGEWLTGDAELTHELPAGAVVELEQEDEEIEVEGEVDPNEDLEVEWDAVTTRFATDDPQGKNTSPLESEIVLYVVILEVDDDEVDRVIRYEVLPEEADEDGEFSLEIDDDLLLPGLDYKIEVGAREESGNQTFWEFPFTTAEDDDEDED